MTLYDKMIPYYMTICYKPIPVCNHTFPAAIALHCCKTQLWSSALGSLEARCVEAEPSFWGCECKK